MGDEIMRTNVRRTMMFLNAQRASLIKDAYIYHPDCVILDLEDAVSESEKDSARFQLYNTLKEIDYGTVEKWVRINPLDTPYYEEDIRCAVAGGADGIRIAKTESAADVKEVERRIAAAEAEFGVPTGQTMIMGAIESPTAVFNAQAIAQASDRMMGIALSAGDFRRTMHAAVTDTGEELFMARSLILMAARAAGIMAFDTVYTDIHNEAGLDRETRLIRDMGFDGKSIINPRQIQPIHAIFTPSAKAIAHAEHILLEMAANKAKGIGVMVVDGQMIDIAMVEGAKRTLAIAKASGKYTGDLQ